MPVVARVRKSGTVYYVVNYFAGRQRWERVGLDRLEAERRDAAMKREIARGVYVPKGAPTVGGFAKDWFRTRTNRTVSHEQSLFDNHIARRCPWFTALRLLDVRAMHVARLVAEVKAPYIGFDEARRSSRAGKIVQLSPKSADLAFGVVRIMFRDARILEKMTRNPFEQLPRETFRFRTRRRVPYTAAEVRALTTNDRIAPVARMLSWLLFFTGMRLGEACGRRFRDWDRVPKPLGSLNVCSQWDGQPLKTEKTIGDAPRLVPVHHELARALDEWRSVGFEREFGRPPTPDDFIIPCRAHRLGCYTRSAAYKLFRRACEAAGVIAHSVHSARHTFISLARRDGADKGWLRRVTHNDKGDVFDQYVGSEWDPMCEAVSCFMRSRPPTIPTSFQRVASQNRKPVDVDIQWIHTVHECSTKNTAGSFGSG
jgi:integrase